VTAKATLLTYLKACSGSDTLVLECEERAHQVGILIKAAYPRLIVKVTLNTVFISLESST
jgi:hypothetical protein